MEKRVTGFPKIGQLCERRSVTLASAQLSSKEAGRPVVVRFFEVFFFFFLGGGEGGVNRFGLMLLSICLGFGLVVYWFWFDC